MLWWLTEKDKYTITTRAFSLFMTTNMGVHAAVIEAVKRTRPDRVRKDGTVKLSRRTVMELKMRVRDML